MSVNNDIDMSAIEVSELTFRYGPRTAIDDLAFSVETGEVFVFLGPNGGGKTTLFRILSTLIPSQSGFVQILGFDLKHQQYEIRSRIGVVFQSPSLDKKLTVQENLRHQGHLYGIVGSDLKQRQQAVLEQFGLSDRAGELTEKLSGGLRRRVELAKSMMHKPRLLLLDEPSTGLDPGARGDLWRFLRSLVENENTTVVMTTHLLEEADKADRIAILNQGRLVALDTPDALKATVGGDSITIRTEGPDELAAMIQEQFDIKADVIDGAVRMEQPQGHRWIPRLAEAFGAKIDSITVGKPTLEDVFIDRCGHRFWQQQDESLSASATPS